MNFISIQNEQHESTLVNFLLGGFSILVLMACWIFIDKTTSVYTLSQFAMTVAFLVNHPHFTSSYMLIYSDFRKNITKSLKYMWAALVAPLLLFAYLFYCLSAERSDLLGHSVNAMFFLVGWHYVKQIFGVVIVTSALKKFYYSPYERSIMLINLLSIWAISFFSSQTYVGSFDFYGIKYQSFGFDKIWLSISYASFVVSLVYVISFHIKRYVQTGARPVSSAVVGLLTLYAWYLPVFSHPHFSYLIPFFHSMQYLVFVWFFKRNQVLAQISQKSGAEKRQAWLIKFVGYIAMALILGALFFEIIPKGLDSVYKFSNSEMGTNPILVVFLLFINIHHYFIDNAIWKSTNPEVKKYLFLDA